MEQPKLERSNEILLSEAEISFVRSLLVQVEQARSELRGALSLKIKQAGVSGVWDLSPDGTRLVLQPPAPQPK